MNIVRCVIAGLVLSVPMAVWAQDARDPALSNYVSLEIGTGKVNVDCAGASSCSRVDSSGLIRLGHRFDPAWAAELTYARTDADFGVLIYRRSAQFHGYGLGAAYTVPVSDSVAFVARAGAMSNHLKFQSETRFLEGPPSTQVSTRSLQPYLGMSASWQFARRWSLNANADWTRAGLRQTPNGAKSDVTVRLLNAGVAFHF